MKRLLLAASGAAAAVAAASTFVLAGPAHAAVGEIAIIQSNGGNVLSIRTENVDNVTSPIVIATSEASGATEATIENATDQPIRVTISGATTVVIDPHQKATLPENGTGEIYILVPAGS